MENQQLREILQTNSIEHLNLIDSIIIPDAGISVSVEKEHRNVVIHTENNESVLTIYGHEAPEVAGLILSVYHASQEFHEPIEFDEDDQDDIEFVTKRKEKLAEKMDQDTANYNVAYDVEEESLVLEDLEDLDILIFSPTNAIEVATAILNSYAKLITL